MPFKFNPTTGKLDLVNSPSSGSGIQSVVAGANVSVDNTNLANPIVSAYDINIDGGVASSIYTSVQFINGGNA